MDAKATVTPMPRTESEAAALRARRVADTRAEVVNAPGFREVRARTEIVFSMQRAHSVVSFCSLCFVFQMLITRHHSYFTQGIHAKVQAAQIGARAQLVQQSAMDDNNKFAGMPEWKRKLLEKKEQQRLAMSDPNLARALASKEEADRQQDAAAAAGPSVPEFQRTALAFQQKRGQ